MINDRSTFISHWRRILSTEHYKYQSQSYNYKNERYDNNVPNDDDDDGWFQCLSVHGIWPASWQDLQQKFEKYGCLQSRPSMISWQFASHGLSSQFSGRRPALEKNSENTSIKTKIYWSHQQNSSWNSTI